MNPTNKRSFIHRANKNRTSESDIPAKFKVSRIIKENFGLCCLTDEVLPIPKDGYASYRQPDLLIKSTDPKIVILLHGPIHNFEEENPIRRKDAQAMDDYKLLEPEYKICVIFGGDKNEYNEEDVMYQMEKCGVKTK